MRVDVEFFIRNQKQRSMGDLPAGALAAERCCDRAADHIAANALFFGR
jgi:hypothetical protein